jgi:acetyl-CoA carboxylase, biotin carboxylase subunit
MIVDRKRVLIANRGEIALRIIRACKSMGHTAIAVYSEADKESLHVIMADEAVCIGPAKSCASYRNIQAILSAAEVASADAIHPGYGFMSENAEFAKAVTDHEFIFIGPTSDHISLMGNKIRAKETMESLGLKTIPGIEGKLNNLQHAKECAQEIGYPVLIKASAGGGGKGMRIASSEEELESAYRDAANEAQVLFGDSEVYMEKYIDNPRHIEFQVLCDGKGHAIHVAERECSIQRRNQKVWEEAPSIVLSAEQRDQYGKIVADAMKKMQYRGVGTLEFLWDGKELYFMEMNTRIQVEHTVTERITSIDLIKWQIRIAFGEDLTLQQEDVKVTGHAIECRINMEDPVTFIPSPGLVEQHVVPGGPYVRIDTMLYPGYKVPSYYDSLGSKLIVWGEDRETCLRNLTHALEEYIIVGPKNLIPLFKKLVRNKDVRQGNLSIKWLDENLVKINEVD